MAASLRLAFSLLALLLASKSCSLLALLLLAGGLPSGGGEEEEDGEGSLLPPEGELACSRMGRRASMGAAC